MTLAIELPPDALARLEREAAREKIAPAEYARRLIEKQLPADPARANSLSELFAPWDVEDATDDPVEMARRQSEWEELKEGLNASHTSDRKLFP